MGSGVKALEKGSGSSYNGTLKSVSSQSDLKNFMGNYRGDFTQNESSAITKFSSGQISLKDFKKMIDQ